MAENIDYARRLVLAHEEERSIPKTIEGHVALFHNLSDPGFVAEFRKRIIQFANDHEPYQYKQS